MTAQIRLGTSACTAAGWSGAFYPRRMKSADYLSFYSTRFDTVEVDHTFYGCPIKKAVNNWALQTPPGFIFSLKAPRTITYEKVCSSVTKSLRSSLARPTCSARN